MPDLSSLLERADRAAASVPLPPDGFERLRARRGRRHRNRRITAGVVGIAVFVGAIIFALSGGSGHRGLTPGSGPTMTPSPTARTVGQIGLAGLPREGMTPSSPSRGELVLSFMFGHTGGDPGRFNLDVYTDGRLIWQRLGNSQTNEVSTGLVEQRLTLEGVELLRSEAISSGLFDHDLHLEGGRGLLSGQARVRTGDRLATVAWGDIELSTVTKTIPTEGQARTLQWLDGRLENLAWLPASAWADQRMRAFVPSRYSVCYATGSQLGLDGVLASLPRSVSDFLRPLERTAQRIEHQERIGGASTLYIWCSTVSTEDARTLAKMIDDSGSGDLLSRDVFGLEYEFGGQVLRQPVIQLSFDPMLPDSP
jgi:hypothetical protein